MQLRILNENQVDEKVDAAIKKTLAICFPNDVEEFSRTRAFEGNVPLFSVYIEDSDKVLAHLAIMDRTVIVGGESVRVAGVANVCVLPEYRKKGLSDMILKAAMEEAMRRHFDFGLVFTGGRIKKVYARNGWIDIPGREFITTRDGKQIELPAQTRMYYPLKKKVFPPGTVDLCGIKW